MFNFIISIITKYKIFKNNDITTLTTIHTKNKIKNYILNSTISLIGHFLIKKILTASWWGTILLFIYESKITTLMLQPILPSLNEIPAKVVENILSSNEIPAKVAENVLSSQIISNGLAEAFSIGASEQIENVLNTQKEDIQNLINDNISIQPTLDTINYVGTAVTYIAISGIVLLILGPAASAGCITGLATNKLTYFSLSYITTNPHVLLIVPKVIGLTAGVATTIKCNSYLVQKHETNETNDT